MSDKRAICSHCRDIFREGDTGALGSCRHLFHEKCLPENTEAWCKTCNKLVFRLQKVIGGLHGPVGKREGHCECTGNDSELRKEIAKYEKEGADVARATAGIKQRTEQLEEKRKELQAELQREMDIKAQLDRDEIERRKVNEELDQQLKDVKEKHEDLCKKHVVDRFCETMEQDEEKAMAMVIQAMHDADKEGKIELLQTIFGLRQFGDQAYDKVRLQAARNDQTLKLKNLFKQKNLKNK